MSGVTPRRGGRRDDGFDERFRDSRPRKLARTVHTNQSRKPSPAARKKVPTRFDRSHLPASSQKPTSPCASGERTTPSQPSSWSRSARPCFWRPRPWVSDSRFAFLSSLSLSFLSAPDQLGLTRPHLSLTLSQARASRPSARARRRWDRGRRGSAFGPATSRSSTRESTTRSRARASMVTASGCPAPSAEG